MADTTHLRPWVGRFAMKSGPPNKAIQPSIVVWFRRTALSSDLTVVWRI
jgi:hypothetical protein